MLAALAAANTEASLLFCDDQSVYVTVMYLVLGHLEVRAAFFRDWGPEPDPRFDDYPYLGQWWLDEEEAVRRQVWLFMRTAELAEGARACT